MTTKIEHILLYTGLRLVEDGCLLIRDGAILYAGERSGCPEGAQEVIDGKGGICMPGLCNAHAHAAMTLLRGVGSDLQLQEWLQQIWPAEDRLNGEHVYNGTMLAAMEMISRGITSFADQYFFMDDTARAVVDSGMRANLSRGIVSTGGNDEQKLQEGVRLFEDWNGAADGRIKVYLAPHAEYTTTPDLIHRATRAAARLNTGIHIHISETPREVEECRQRYGISPVRYFEREGMFEVPVIGAHCVAVDDEDIAILARRQVKVVHNPASNMKLASGVAPVTKMMAAGIDVALGTDGVASNNTTDLFADMKLAAILQKGFLMDPTAMPVEKVLHMATRAGALAMGFENVGVLEAGMRADLLILDKDAPNLTPSTDVLANLVYAAQGLNVRLTMVDGKVLYKNGEYLTLDKEKVLFEAQKSAHALGL